MIVRRVVSWVADAFLPNLSFWFDPRDEGAYLAHRMPLYRKGPEVMIVKDGIHLGSLGHFP